MDTGSTAGSGGSARAASGESKTYVHGLTQHAQRGSLVASVCTLIAERALQMLPPVIAAAFPRGRDAAAGAALEQLATTHESVKLARAARSFAGLLCDMLAGEAVEAAVARSGQPVDAAADDLAVVYKRHGPACYIESSFPVAVHFLTKCDPACLRAPHGACEGRTPGGEAHIPLADT